MNIRDKHNLFSKLRKGQEIVPIKAHVTKNIVLTNQDDLLGVIEFQGVNYADKSMEQLRNYKTHVNNLIRNIQDPRLGVWTCMLRRKVDVDINEDLKTDFAQKFAKQYRENINKFAYKNTFYMALVFSPNTNVAKFSKKKNRLLFQEIIEAGVKKLEEKLDLVFEALLEYKPRLLGISEEHEHRRCSEIGAFYTDLLYGVPHEIPVRCENLANAVFNKKVLYGSETLEIRHASESSFAVVLGVKEYMSSTEPDVFYGLNGTNFEFNLVQSFLFVTKPNARSLLIRQQNVLVSSGDEAASQVAELTQALDDLISGKIVMTEHCISMIAFCPNESVIREITNSAQAAFQETGIVVVREDLANEGHYRSQLPGNYAYRPRVSTISSLNMSSFIQMYNPPPGKADNNYWGKAVLPLMGPCGEVFYFSNHIEDTGSLAVTGMSGAGKTVLINAMLTMLRREGVRHVFFDKDEGAKICVHALEGQYSSIKIGKRTGFNPFDMPLNEANVYFVVDLIYLMVGDPYTSEHRNMVSSGVKMVFALSDGNRSLSSLINFLDPTDPLGVAVRLEEWVGNGRNAWVFDNNKDELTLGDLTAFDVTEFIDNATVRTPIMSYLIHRVMGLINGEPIVIWMDEFWKLLQHDYFRDDFVNNKYKTIRKENGCLIFATQSPSDALNSSISHTLIEQTPSKVFLPNEYANEEQYTKGFNLTQPEWQAFKGLTKASRQFIVKQGDSSVVMQMPLYGLDDILMVLSGTKANNFLFDEILESHQGKLPKDWIQILKSKQKEE